MYKRKRKETTKQYIQGGINFEIYDIYYLNLDWQNRFYTWHLKKKKKPTHTPQGHSTESLMFSCAQVQFSALTLTGMLYIHFMAY